MKVDKFISLIKAMGFNVTLGDEENYYIDEDPKVRIHFDADTKEVYPLFSYKSGYSPRTEKQILNRLKRLSKK